MWSFKNEIQTQASPEKIWQLWSEVKEWKKWDYEIEDSYLLGDFTEGTIGFLKPKGGPKTKFKLLKVDPLKGFWDRSYLPLTHLDFIHSIRKENSYFVVSHEVRFKGLLSFLFSKIIGQKIKQEMPKAMKQLVTLAEQ